MNDDDGDDDDDVNDDLDNDGDDDDADDWNVYRHVYRSSIDIQMFSHALLDFHGFSCCQWVRFEGLYIASRFGHRMLDMFNLLFYKPLKKTI